MKYKKDFGVLLVVLGFTWEVFDYLGSDYTPTQVILVVIFAYIGIRLTYFVYVRITNCYENKHKKTINPNLDNFIYFFKFYIS